MNRFSSCVRSFFRFCGTREHTVQLAHARVHMFAGFALCACPWRGGYWRVFMCDAGIPCYSCVFWMPMSCGGDNSMTASPCMGHNSACLLEMIF